jgi:hypothetical protein
MCLYGHDEISLSVCADLEKSIISLEPTYANGHAHALSAPRCFLLPRLLHYLLLPLGLFGLLGLLVSESLRAFLLDPILDREGKVLVVGIVLLCLLYYTIRSVLYCTILCIGSRYSK